MTIAKREFPTVTGYDTELRYYATRYKQGGRTVYALDLSLTEIQSLINKPDPDTPTPGNRAIRPAHAAAFGKYLREHDDWVVPGMILRVSTPFEFEEFKTVGRTSFGVVSFPRQAANDIHILDGQHRILGIHLAEAAISADLDKARSALGTARRVDPEGAGVKQAQERIDMLNRQRERMSQERISVQIFVEADITAYRQMFFDIADNAIGITSSVKARFDTRKAVNRALEYVLEHPLLQNRVDPEKDRIRGSSPYLMGAKHVGEITRAVLVGLEGRVSRRQDAELSEQGVAKQTRDFLDDITEAFPPLKAVEFGQILPEGLRKTSLLGSVLMMRVLAGVYYDLIANHAFDREMVVEFFRKLNRHMAGPVYSGSIWASKVNGSVFGDGAMAPSGRRQDLYVIRDAIVAWALDRPSFLDEAPAARPAPAEDELA